MIETYFHSGEGYNPFLVREGWQVAQLNYLPGHGFDEIEQIEVHRETDEVFILFKGDAILIEAKPQKDTISLYCERKQDCAYQRLSQLEKEDLYSMIRRNLL